MKQKRQVPLCYYLCIFQFLPYTKLTFSQLEAGIQENLKRQAHLEIITTGTVMGHKYGHIYWKKFMELLFYSI